MNIKENQAKCSEIIDRFPESLCTYGYYTLYILLSIKTTTVENRDDLALIVPMNILRIV